MAMDSGDWRNVTLCRQTCKHSVGFTKKIFGCSALSSRLQSETGLDQVNQVDETELPLCFQLHGY